MSHGSGREEGGAQAKQARVNYHASHSEIGEGAEGQRRRAASAAGAAAGPAIRHIIKGKSQIPPFWDT